jgi:8-oxo-dGTP diphosphatase
MPKGKYIYDYPKADNTVDCVVFGYDAGELRVLLIERKGEPFKGTWALPGGFVQMDETLEQSALRELEEETGITSVYLEQLYTFGDPGRDPRGRVISVAYYALVKLSDYNPNAGSDAREARWFSLSESLPPLAFDHAKILDVAWRRLKTKARYEPIGFELLPKEFTLTSLQRLYESILNQPLDKRNFRSRILGMGLLTELSKFETSGRHRPARLYSFDRNAYESLKTKGFSFEL